jgi:F-type H+-transporting ATPase subunit delta
MTSKKIETLAKKLLKKSLSADRVDPKKVTEIMASLKQLKPNNLLEVYKSYLDLLELKIEEQTAYVETPLAPDTAWAKELEKDLRAKFPSVTEVRFVVNPSLIAGLKVKIADMVYENSYQSRLQSLRSMN